MDRDIAAILKTSGELKAEIVAIVGDLTYSAQHPFDLYKERPELIESETDNCLREFGGLKGVLDLLIATKKLEERRKGRVAEKNRDTSFQPDRFLHLLEDEGR